MDEVHRTRAVPVAGPGIPERKPPEPPQMMQDPPVRQLRRQPSGAAKPTPPEWPARQVSDGDANPGGEASDGTQTQTLRVPDEDSDPTRVPIADVVLMLSYPQCAPVIKSLLSMNLETKRITLHLIKTLFPYLFS